MHIAPFVKVYVQNGGYLLFCFFYFVFFFLGGGGGGAKISNIFWGA